MTERSIDVDMTALDAREIPHPPHSWETAKRCIRTACDAGEHDWAELTTRNDEPLYWRECRTCGIADVTVEELGSVAPITACLQPYREESGFESVAAWRQAIEDVNGSLPNSGYLYRATERMEREDANE